MKSLRRIAALFTLLSGGIFMLLSGAFGRGESSSKLRLMMRHSGLVATGTVLALCVVLAGGLYLAERPTTLRAAYDSTDQDDATFMQLFAKQLVRDGARIRLNFLPQKGGLETANAIDTGKADIALVRHDLAAAKKGLAITIVRHNALVLMAPAKGSLAAGGPKAHRGKGVDAIDDIGGKRIGVIGNQDDYTSLLNIIFKEYGIAADKVKIIALDPAHLADALRQNPVDVLAALGPVAAPSMAEAVAAATYEDRAPKFLTLDAAEAIGERHLELEASEIKAGAFEGRPLRPDDTVEVIGYADLIVGRPTLSENLAFELTRRILNGRQEFNAALPRSVKVQAPDASKDTDLPVHPGTAAYINDSRQTFFDRYGDFIYLGLMVVSGFGSAMAWLVSYARANVRHQRSTAVSHVLQMAKRAHAATSFVELDALSGEIGDILVRAVHRAEHDSDASDTLPAMAMAIDHLRHAIAERRAALTHHAAPPAPRAVQARG
jgi:TRAP-type uncharacterized transport system substrate-binding protein